VITNEAYDPNRARRLQATAIRVEKLRSAREGSLPAVDLHLMTAEPAPRNARRSTRCSERRRRAGTAERTERDLRVAHAPQDNRTSLLPVLHALQGRIGWISEGGLNYACERLSVPPAEAYGVATFYAMFSVQPQPATVLHVCDDLACRIRGGGAMAERLTAACGGDPKVVRSPCLGLCDAAPAVLFQEAGEGAVSRAVAPADADRILESLHGARALVPPPALAPRHGGERLLRRVGSVDPTSLHDYRAHDGYAALARAIELGPDAVIQQVTDARLLGRGGAAFPTGVKWRAVADQPPGPKYVVCNADESEPGTFKDRVLMENDPFAIIEALTIAGLATGAATGYLYIRGEYPLATRHLHEAIEEARRPPCWAPTSCVPGSHSISRFAVAPARTSAARRPRCSTRSRASAASRATSRRSP
jgi:NADH-quinone oxidoreductase subunit F